MHLRLLSLWMKYTFLLLLLGAWASVPARNTRYSQWGAEKNFKKEIFLKVWAWVREVTSEWRSMLGRHKAGQQGPERAAWREGCRERRGLPFVQRRGRCPALPPPPHPPPSSAFHWLNPAGSQRARKSWGEQSRVRRVGCAPGRQMKSIQNKAQT